MEIQVVKEKLLNLILKYTDLEAELKKDIENLPIQYRSSF